MVAVACAAMPLLGAGAADAATIVFGSDLSQPATRAFPSPYDIAFWSTQLPNGSSTQAPAAGQILELRIKGCAERSKTNPPGATNYREPFTETHFQDLKPQANGTLVANVTTNPFFTPICGDPGIDQDFISTFKPTNFCVGQGDYVDWNDAGGFDGVPDNYPQGVYYDFFAPSAAARTLFFRAPDATNNGDTFTSTPATEDLLGPTTASPLYPYAFNYNGTGSQNLELLMQVTLGTGPDATPLCPGGTQGTRTPTPTPDTVNGGPPVIIHRQTEGVNRARLTTVNFFCARLKAPCTGTVSLNAAGAGVGVARHAPSVILASANFNVPDHKTARIRLRLTTRALSMLRKGNRHLTATMTVTLDPGGSANTFGRAIGLKI